MQKSLLILLVVAIVGAVTIFKFVPELPAYLTFLMGIVIAGIVFILSQSGSQTSIATYKGPTKTLYVGNLPYRVHESEVKALFQDHGPVTSVRLVRDRKTGRRKGFGFVEMSEVGADKARLKLNDYTFQERTLKVREARTQESFNNRDEDE
ncbi:RNA-binding protein [Parashewanella spongiae]|uniref:RNA-binding protein n=1 Tax=Parashewanella spongiae TaxID=342950 RepID=A0A3A6TRN8_9GAMM|nr:RNA-binding protein [Parashewanella spongiae]MCL1077168.1 RNA-binding protein [Parashewanella spongiae]RJY18808.1 RNA-binding protein [Parashewanella spongiae]